MKKSLLVVLLVSFFVLSEKGLAKEQEDNRYVLKILKERGSMNTRVPALVLDSSKGVIWTSPNIQTSKPIWIKADLAQLNGQDSVGKKYVVRMLESQEGDLKMPAIVLDVDRGIAWTCYNIIDTKALWVAKDLNKGFERRIFGKKVKALRWPKEEKIEIEELEEEIEVEVREDEESETD